MISTRWRRSDGIPAALALLDDDHIPRAQTELVQCGGVPLGDVERLWRHARSYCGSEV